MKTIKLMAIALLALAALSCNTATHENHQTDELNIELNDGEKWLVNDEMKPYVLNGEKILKEFEGDEYLLLAEQLEDKNFALIKSCTMKGKSHDELHKWLHPHLEMVEALSETENRNDAEKIVKELKNSYKIYHKYFQ